MSKVGKQSFTLPQCRFLNVPVVLTLRYLQLYLVYSDAADAAATTVDATTERAKKDEKRWHSL